MPSPRRPKTSVDYLDGHISSEDESSHKRSTRPRGYSPKLQRGISETSLMRQERKAEEMDNDSQFESDTDYDPRDKYYLSAEDDPLDSHLPERKETARNHLGKDHKSHSRHSSSQPGSSLRSGHTHSRSHGSSHGHHHHHHSHRHSHSQSHSHSHSHSRDLDHHDDHHDRHKQPAPSSKPSSQASRPRPRPSRASSSYLSAIRRPQMKRAGSSYNSASRVRPRPRPRPVRGLSHNSRQTNPKINNSKQTNPKTSKMPWEDFPWEDAAKVALQAGGVALMKVGTEQMPWRTKGTKIASAALGAAVVDHVLKPNKRGGVKYAAMRHLAEVAVGNMVVSPALGKVGGSGGKKR